MTFNKKIEVLIRKLIDFSSKLSTLILLSTYPFEVNRVVCCNIGSKQTKKAFKKVRVINDIVAFRGKIEEENKSFLPF